MTDGDDLTVLCVDPASDARAETVAMFGRDGFRTVAAGDVAAAIDAAGSHDVDCAVAEYRLPDGTGFDVFEALRERHPGAVCVLFTDASREDIDSSAFQDTVAEYLPKGGPAARDRLVEVVRTAVRNRTQVGFPLPPDEDGRLEAVAEYDVEALAAVDTFDRISKLIASHFDVDVAFVGLVDEREERFLACHGADWDQLTREDSVCTYAILDEAVTVVEDVRADPRFEHNETLARLGVRSYAGANLTTPDGRVVGELCCIDDEPRPYTDAERTDLELFAAEVSEQLELRRRLGATTLEEQG